MQLKDEISVVGSLHIQLFDKDGKLKDERQIDNLVVTTGLTFTAARLVGTPNAMSHMAVGSNSTAPVAANTALGTELGRVALASAASSGATATYSASFPAGTGTGAIVEAGIFNAATAGTMLNRATFAVVNKGADDSMSIVWNVTYAV
jgi:hypothetical protein